MSYTRCTVYGLRIHLVAFVFVGGGKGCASRLDMYATALAIFCSIRPLNEEDIPLRVFSFDFLRVFDRSARFKQDIPKIRQAVSNSNNGSRSFTTMLV